MNIGALHNKSQGASRPRVLVLGDSIAAGALSVDGTTITDRLSPTFVDLLAERFATLEFVVDAVALRRTPDVLGALPGLLERVEPAMVLVATGANDADLDWRRFVISDGAVVRSRTPIERYASDLASMARLIRAHRAWAILAEPIGLHLASRAPHLCSLVKRDLGPAMERAGGQAHADEIVGRYRDASALVAAEFGFLHCPLGPDLASQDPSRVLAADGTHPNELGHRVMAETLGTALAMSPLVAGEGVRIT